MKPLLIIRRFLGAVRRGRGGAGNPQPLALPVRDEQGVRVIDGPQLLPGVDELTSDALFQGIPHLDRNKGITAQDQGQQKSLESEVGKLPMNEFILDQASDLTVDHPVKLCDQRNIIAELPVLGEELKPLVPVFPLPFAGVKEQLALVNDKEDRALVFRTGPAPLEVLAGVFHEKSGRQLIIWAVCIVRPLILAQVTLEVTDHRLPQLGADDNIPGIVQALTRAGRSAVKSYHINHLSLSTISLRWSIHKTAQQLPTMST